MTAVVHDLGYTRPTPIQIEAIPALLAGRNIIAQSQTGSEDLADIHQLKLCFGNDDKLAALYRTLQFYPHESALVFCNQKATVREITGELIRGGFSIDRFDGDLEPFDRDQVLARFRNYRWIA